MASDKGEQSKTKSEKSSKKLNHEQIIAGFNQLRNEQRSLVTKVAEIEVDLSEHTLVAENLKKVDGNRKCFRMIGGVLVERTVKDVLPAIISNKEQLQGLIEKLNQQIKSKGNEIVEYREKYSIQVRGEPVNSSQGE